MKNRKEENMDELDEILKQYILHKYKNAPKPLKSADEAWKEIDAKLNPAVKARSSWIPYKKAWISIASIVILVFIFLVINPSNSSAFIKFSNIFYKIQDSIVQVFTKVGDDSGADPNDVPLEGEFQVVPGSEIVTEKLSLEEAQKVSSFDIKTPSYVPAGFELLDVTVLRSQNGYSSNIYLNYSREMDSFTFYQISVSHQHGSGEVIQNEENDIEVVSVNNYMATLITYKQDNTVRLIWVTENTYYSIEGDLSKDEVLQIANSL